VPGVTDIFGIKALSGFSMSRGSLRLPPALVLALLFLPWLLALGLLLRMRARERRLSDPEGVRARGAAAAFRARIRKPDTDPAEAFVEFLAARLRLSPASLICPDPVRKMKEAGLPAQDAAPCASCLEQLVAARYGSEEPLVTMEKVQALVERVEALFQKKEKKP
jgi:hypothetical protein